LIVAELKREVAPHTIHMQAVNYAAMVSRLTPDDIAQIQGVCQSSIVLAQKVGPHIDLEALPFVLDCCEEGLAELPEKDDPAGDSRGRGGFGEGFGGQALRSGTERGDRFPSGKGGPVGIDASQEKLVPFLATDPFMFGLFEGTGGLRWQFLAQGSGLPLELLSGASEMP
jgi:hypothetical protein